MKQKITDIHDVVNVESEAGIIATLIQHPEFAYSSDKLTPNHFSEIENRCLYAAITNLTQRGVKQIDAFNVMQVITNVRGIQSMADGITLEKVKELVENSKICSRDSLEEYKILVENVMTTAFRREMYDGLQECIELCLNPDGEDVKKAIYNTIDEKITEYSMTEDLPEYKDVIDNMWEQIEERQAVGYAGVPFKFPALNDYVTCERGELVIFGAQQKVGKSIMLLNIAVDLAQQGYSVLYIDSELSSRLFTGRLLSHLTGITYRNLTSGAYSDDELVLIRQKIAEVKKWKFTHVYMPFFDQEGIYTAARQSDWKYGGLDVIIVDYFKATGSETDAYATYAAMGRCVDLVKNEIAGSMNVMAIGAAQATSTGKLADSAKIARNASTIIMIEDKTPEEIEEDGIECGNKKMIVKVNRNGAQMIDDEYIDLVFDGDHILYEQAKQHEKHEPY